mmetsp:Transcript_11669/g.22337  ORF Transcript_11669/g.22337 Transcript_11669/m.22337 type:complete len:87 (-) Transcript_11669:334-594(-)
MQMRTLLCNSAKKAKEKATAAPAKVKIAPATTKAQHVIESSSPQQAWQSKGKPSQPTPTVAAKKQSSHAQQPASKHVQLLGHDAPS